MQLVLITQSTKVPLLKQKTAEIPSILNLKSEVTLPGFSKNIRTFGKCVRHQQGS